MLAMTRTHRTNSREAVHDALPRSFGKHDEIKEPRDKKQGAGKGNWGREGDEVQDLKDYVTVNPRRRSNSNGGNGDIFLEKTKFEAAEPVFEEQ